MTFGVKALNIALEDAALNVEEIGYISAHGTATQLNDVSETKAVKAAFGDQAYHVPLSSTKSMTGHMMGATGALEAIFCIQAVNFADPHPNGFNQKDSENQGCYR